MSEQPLRSRKKAHRSAVRSTIPVNRLSVLTHGWLLDGDLRQLSPQTRSARRFLLEKLEWFLRAEGYEDCGLAELRAFLVHVSTAHESAAGRWGKGQATSAPRPRTVHTYHGNLRTFFRWLVQEGEIEESPLERMRPPVARVDQIQPFTETQLASLLAVARRSRFPRRDEAIHLFLLDTGARASELCGVRMKDLDLTGRRCTVTGKGNKRRSVYLNAPTVRAVSSYLRELPLENGDPLFSSHGQGAVGEPLTRSGLFQLVERWGKVAEVQGVRCSPHTYRHTFAVNFVRNGGNAFTLMQMLGHTSLTMSKRYVALAEADLESQHARFSPVARMISK